jgi:hypothetical protein
MEPMSPKNNSTTADRFALWPALPSSRASGQRRRPLSRAYRFKINSANQDFASLTTSLGPTNCAPSRARIIMFRP